MNDMKPRVGDPKHSLYVLLRSYEAVCRKRRNCGGSVEEDGQCVGVFPFRQRQHEKELR